MKIIWQTLCLGFIFYGCTTIGIADNEALKNMNFGPPEKVRICVYRDVNISDRQADDIIAALQQEFSQFGIEIEAPWVKPWKRTAFMGDKILNDFVACPLESPCDRLLALVGRGPLDFLWGIIMPEVNGLVEDVTMTKGLAVAEIGSLNQILSLSSARRIAIHETYHLLGCGHDIDAKSCYEKIKMVKKIARRNRMAGRDFFPSVPLDQSVLISRSEVEKKLKPYQKNEAACSKPPPA